MKYLELDVGEMIDIGIYAPYLSTDIKSMKEFRNKCDRLLNMTTIVTATTTTTTTCCSDDDNDGDGDGDGDGEKDDSKNNNNQKHDYCCSAEE
jgi:hypothetical protein